MDVFAPSTMDTPNPTTALETVQGVLTSLHASGIVAKNTDLEVKNNAVYGTVYLPFEYYLPETLNNILTTLDAIEQQYHSEIRIEFYPLPRTSYAKSYRRSRSL